MGIKDILSLFGGLALFLYGMQMMSNGLEAAAGNKMKSILEKLTSNRIKGVLVGAACSRQSGSSWAPTSVRRSPDSSSRWISEPSLRCLPSWAWARSCSQKMKKYITSAALWQVSASSSSVWI